VDSARWGNLAGAFLGKPERKRIAGSRPLSLGFENRCYDKSPVEIGLGVGCTIGTVVTAIEGRTGEEEVNRRTATKTQGPTHRRQGRAKIARALPESY
jgi:hypothetical protein